MSHSFSYLSSLPLVTDPIAVASNNCARDRLHKDHCAQAFGRNTLSKPHTICTCSIVTCGSFTIWTHCIAIAWESPGDSHNFSYFTPSLHISCCNPQRLTLRSCDPSKKLLNLPTANHGRGVLLLVGEGVRYHISYFKDIYFALDIIYIYFIYFIK